MTVSKIIISWAFLQGSGLLILSKSLFKLIAKRLWFVTTQSNEVPSAKSLGLDTKFSDKLLMQINSNIWPSMEPWGTSDPLFSCLLKVGRSRSQMFFKIGVLKNFADFKEK